jgi:manganese/zinc/iron transport system ATP- binding protein
MEITTAIEVHDLTVTYRHNPVLWAIDFKIPTGSLVAIVGPNGAGKSTLLKAIMNLIPVASGYVKILDKDLNTARSLVAYVPQKEEVDWDFPICVEDVVLMGRSARLPFYKKPTNTDREIAKEALSKLGMLEFSKRQISELSGGQQQRVFLARALVQEAQVYLLDEPFSGIDVTTEEIIVNLLKELTAQGKTIVCVHHDLSTVNQYFDWTIMLNLRLVTAGPTNQVFTQEKIQQTYSGRLRMLDEVAQKLRNEQWSKKLK